MASKITPPLLSIIIPTHFRARELKRCLSSIVSSVNIEKEIIIVSDVKCPSTREVVGQFLGDNDTYYERPGKPGPAASRNIGLEISRGDFVLIFDDDDQLPGPDYIKFLSAAVSNPWAVSYGDVIIVKEDRKKNTLTNDPPERPGLTNFFLPNLFIKNFIFTQAVIFPRRAIIGRFQDEFMKSVEDWDFLLNILSTFDFKPLNHVGAVIYKDFINLGNRRGSTKEATNFNVALDYLYVYRRWPAPSVDLKKQRSEMLLANGISVPAEYL